ncbi:hypothetical protein Hanom_Chr03g00215621 [Helianthus anomalus]
MVDDVEYGEIRSPEITLPSPEKEVRPSTVLKVDPQVDPLKVSVHEHSSSFEKLDNERTLHEKHGGKHGECSIPRESNYNNEGSNVLAAGEVDGGPNMQEERDFNFVDQLNQVGPSPISGLGKRSKAY